MWTEFQENVTTTCHVEEVSMMTDMWSHHRDLLGGPNLERGSSAVEINDGGDHGEECGTSGRKNQP